jgi:hypothetical protein
MTGFEANCLAAADHFFACRGSKPATRIRALLDRLDQAEAFAATFGDRRTMNYALNGAAFGRDVIDFNADDASPTNTGQFILALDIKAFGDVATFKTRVDSIRAEMKSSPLRPGFDGIRLPGERAFAVRQERLAHGVPVGGKLLTDLDAEAQRLGIPPLTVRT